MSEFALELADVSKSFGGVRAVDHVSFAVPHCGLTAVIGPNGAGKTTLFNLVTNLYPADEGDVRFYGEALRAAPPGAIAAKGLIPTVQSARIFPAMTALDNVRAGGGVT